ncbi:1-phosphofructokinase family hexose kinase [Corynebacterium tapiri]|uniref:1-phosphofructokinase family hexose kinase n=1 Tax=Corynebacterium tapiri TaxID=1448266 RepID=A0A5C4U4X6_9CORY|nr:1-phosphofructokinase family hexose kinase [Corynebacterium tapiri]TNL99219.1 1-phosphofructokinase family hexose kinase [Corynebacterium tapiri]
MIVTCTPNPSIDTTVHIPEGLQVGEVNRAASVERIAGGKGINVSRAAHLARTETCAVFPASQHDPFVPLVDATGIAARRVDSTGEVRVNTTVTDANGETTKLNGPGAALSDACANQLISTTASAAANAQAIVLAGSLPPGLAIDYYVTASAQLHRQCPQALIAVDTSDAPLQALGTHLDEAHVDVLKPNEHELAQLSNTPVESLDDVVTAARHLISRGVGAVLATLGGHGAVLVTSEGAWHAQAGPVEVRSTVGAGDSSLAGYLLARLAGLSPDECLARAVAYGSAAASLSGTHLPAPADADKISVTTQAL